MSSEDEQEPKDQIAKGLAKEQEVGGQAEAANLLRAKRQRQNTAEFNIPGSPTNELSGFNKNLKRQKIASGP